MSIKKAPTSEITVPSRALGLRSPAKLAEFATTLKNFIISEKLFTPIKGKNYVNIEGWQFAGAATGVFPVVRVVEKLEPTKPDFPEIRYRAEIELRTNTDKVVGYGVAICSDKEANKRGSDEYVIASMAQTRAIGKAYRNVFAWLMKIAGYEGTPAEEMMVETIETKEDNGEPATPAQIKTIQTLCKTKDAKIDTEGMTQEKAKQTIKFLIGGKNGK